FAGQAKFSEELQTLYRLSSDSPQQTARLDALREGLNRWRSVYASPQLARPQSQIADPALAERGRVAMGEVRQLLDDLRAEEALAAQESEEARDRAYTTARIVVGGVGLAALGFGTSLGLWAVRASARREREAVAFAKAKTRTLAVVSHEIRTPLNGMLGMLQAMAAEPMAATQKERLEVALESGETLTALLNDLLDASKIEAGRLELLEADFDLTRLLARMETAFGETARKKGVPLRIDIAPEAAGDWIGDKVRIGQILANLISNAVKFTDQGEVALSVDVPSAGLLRIAVRDSGMGMNEATLGRLFSPYAQASAETAHTHGGTGLGLAISRSLARMMGGDITVTSAVGQGSCFTLELPLQRGRSATTEPESARSLADLHVLAADDNAVNRQVLSAILPSLGVELTVVENGDQAVAAWREGAYDLVLLDLRMPLCDGFEAARRIRAEETPGRRTPLILLSGDVSASVREQGREAGLDGFVAKPLDIHMLIEAMSAALPPAHTLAA
ncbi:MAG: response regulator, partial [Alphaproteobacteria bacterium]|nr:response regulator [Alphaproteobacteria bacterium]